MPKRPNQGYQSFYNDPLTVNDGALDVSPLGSILKTMHQRHASGDLEAAMSLARIAAPYLHPRVPSAAPQMDLATMPDAELDALRSQD